MTSDLPPLRDRKKDIPLLAKFFVSVFARKLNIQEPAITPEFMEKMQQHDWKGNIRELKNSIERAVIVSNGEPLIVTHLPIELRGMQTKPENLSAFDLRSVEKLHIQRVLNHTRYTKAEAARLLNIGLATLYRKMEVYKLN